MRCREKGEQSKALKEIHEAMDYTNSSL